MFKTLPTNEIGRLLKADLVKRHKESARITRETIKANENAIAILAEPIVEGV